MNKLVSIWAAVIAFPVVLLLLCICCPCICYTGTIYDARREHRNGTYNNPTCLKLVESFSSAWDFVVREREPNIASKKVHPFKLRSPFSVSKHYKSPDSLDKIIEKPSPEVSIIHLSINYYTLNFDL